MAPAAAAAAAAPAPGGALASLLQLLAGEGQPFAIDTWSILLTSMIGLGLAIALGYNHDDDVDQAAPTVTLRKEQRHLRHLVLPGDAVREAKAEQTEQETGKNNHRHRIRRKATEMMDWFHLAGQRTRWDECAIDAEAVSGHRPLLVFVNSRSGGGQGTELLRELQTLLHRLQVVDLREETPQQALKWWSQTGQRYRVLVCGGDGTVGWILSCLEELQPEYMPPVAILPVGTGNDLARVMGWGGGFGGGSVVPILQKVGEARAAYLDRWSVECRDLLPDSRPKALPMMGIHDRRSMIMCNYFGIGVDAAVALDFHTMRERRPHLFVSRLVNKAWYLKSGTLNPLRSLCRDVASKITLECDGKAVEVPRDVEGVVVLNIPSFGGGCDLWGQASDDEEDSDDDGEEEEDEDSDDDERGERFPELTARRKQPQLLRRSLSHIRPSMQDHRLEVVAVHGSFQLGAAQVGLYAAQRLAQAREVRIVTKQNLPVQVDGEPWLFAKEGEVKISYKGQALMLSRKSSGAHAVATDVIDWALEKQHISVGQRNILMREISRRAQAGGGGGSAAGMGGRTSSLPTLLAGI